MIKFILAIRNFFMLFILKINSIKITIKSDMNGEGYLLTF